MKACLLLQRRFAYIGHYIALALKEKYGLTDFCGYVLMRSSYDFLIEQKDIQYSTLLLDENIHKKYKKEKIDLKYLSYLEKEFGIPNLWPYIMIDRVIMSNIPIREYPYNNSKYTHEEMLKIVQIHAKSIIEMLNKEKPDFLFCSVVGNVGSLLLYNIAKKMGIKTFFLTPSCTDGRQIIIENYYSFTFADKKLDQWKKTKNTENIEKAKKFLTNFREKPKTYHTKINPIFLNTNLKQKLLLTKKIYKSISWYIKILIKYPKQIKFKDYTYDMNPCYYVVDRIKRKIRNIIITEKIYDSFNENEDFAFYPLHLEPEISILLHAPFFINQIETIKHIARSLPIHYKLYVKEHPLMVGHRAKNFYKEIKKIPNVKLIDHKIDSFSIIKKSKLITTITGTAGWEAILLKKPVITFGEVFYNKLSTVKRCSEIEKLPYMIKDQLENFKHNEEELLIFLNAILEDSVPVDLIKLWEDEWDLDKKRKGVEPLADLLAKKLNLEQIKK